MKICMVCGQEIKESKQHFNETGHPIYQHTELCPMYPEGFNNAS